MFLRSITKRPLAIIIHELHTSAAVLKQDKYVPRQAQMLKKLMTGSNRSRKKFFSVDQTPAKQFAELKFLDSSTKSGSKRPVSGRALRRVRVLNVLFVEQITSLLSTGEVGAHVLDMGLEITAVKVSPDFERVNVYWQPTGTEKDDVFDSVLPQVGRQLRHELSQLRVIGIVPPICFVRDPFQDRIAQIESVLLKCDFGPDFTPTNVGDVVKRMKPVPVNPKAQFPKHLAAQIEKMNEYKLTSKLDDTENEATPEEIDEENAKITEDKILNQSLEDILQGPEMRNDILGLNHTAIMKKITHAVKVRQARKTSDPNLDNEFVSDSVEFPIPTFPVEEEDRTKSFLKYLEKKKRDKLKLIKLNSTQAADKDFVESELFERWEQHQERIISKFRFPDTEGSDDTFDYIDDDEVHDESQTRP